MRKFNNFKVKFSLFNYIFLRISNSLVKLLWQFLPNKCKYSLCKLIHFFIIVIEFSYLVDSACRARLSDLRYYSDCYLSTSSASSCPPRREGSWRRRRPSRTKERRMKPLSRRFGTWEGKGRNYIEHLRKSEGAIHSIFFFISHPHPFFCEVWQ